MLSLGAASAGIRLQRSRVYPCPWRTNFCNRSRDSSAGRASGHRSKCPRLDPGCSAENCEPRCRENHRTKPEQPPRLWRDFLAHRLLQPILEGHARVCVGGGWGGALRIARPRHSDRCSREGGTSTAQGLRTPCGQRPMDFLSIPLAARTHSHAFQVPALFNPRQRARPCCAGERERPQWEGGGDAGQPRGGAELAGALRQPGATPRRSRTTWCGPP